MNIRGKNALYIALALGLVLIVGLYIGFHDYLTLDLFKNNKIRLESAVSEHYSRTVFFYVLLYIAVIAFALPGVPVLTVAGGFLFGFIPGGIYAAFAATTGSTISFFVMRHLFANVLRGRYADRLEKFNNKINEHGVAYYLLTLQLMGLVPYFVINVLAALTYVDTLTFLWTTFVGSLPILFIYSFAGKQIFLINSIQDIFSPTIIGLLILLMILAVAPLLLRFSRRVTDL